MATIPTKEPTSVPSTSPTASPSTLPSVSPSTVPSTSPSPKPSWSPSTPQTRAPSIAPPPTAAPSSSPTLAPTVLVTVAPTPGTTLEGEEAAGGAAPSPFCKTDWEDYGQGGHAACVPCSVAADCPSGKMCMPDAFCKGNVKCGDTASDPLCAATSAEDAAAVGTTAAPTEVLTTRPTNAPVVGGGGTPVVAPSQAPTASPTASPSGAPSVSPSVQETRAPSIAPPPTLAPTSEAPTATGSPTIAEVEPTAAPTTAEPTSAPSAPPLVVTAAPSSVVATVAPSAASEEEDEGGGTSTHFCQTAWEEYSNGNYAECIPCTIAADCPGGKLCMAAAFCTRNDFDGNVECGAVDVDPRCAAVEAAGDGGGGAGTEETTNAPSAPTTAEPTAAPSAVVATTNAPSTGSTATVAPSAAAAEEEAPTNFCQTSWEDYNGGTTGNYADCIPCAIAADCPSGKMCMPTAFCTRNDDGNVKCGDADTDPKCAAASARGDGGAEDEDAPTAQPTSAAVPAPAPTSYCQTSWEDYNGGTTGNYADCIPCTIAADCPSGKMCMPTAFCTRNDDGNVACGAVDVDPKCAAASAGGDGGDTDAGAAAPTPEPGPATSAPSIQTAIIPTRAPSRLPTGRPTARPTQTHAPSAKPSVSPSSAPSVSPSAAPSPVPSAAPTGTPSEAPLLTTAMVAAHGSRGDCWVIIDAFAYDLTAWFNGGHPGGMQDYACGTDASAAFNAVGSHAGVKPKGDRFRIGPQACPPVSEGKNCDELGLWNSVFTCEFLRGQGMNCDGCTCGVRR